MTMTKSESSPLLQTLYFDVDIGIGAARKLTAVFFPASYAPTGTPDALVYFHGLTAPVVDRYLKLPQYALREATNTADAAKTKNLICIAPTLGPACEAGKIVDSGLGWYLSEVLSGIAASAGDRLAGSAKPSFGKVYLAAHSGGGRPARAVAMKGASVTEYWLFDALYAPVGYPAKPRTSPVAPIGDPGAVEEEWLDVLTKQSVKLYDHFLTSEPTTRSTNLEAFVKGSAKPVRVQPTFVKSTSPDHEHVPITHWKDRVNGRS